jgi:hypothetical protein
MGIWLHAVSYWPGPTQSVSVLRSGHRRNIRPSEAELWIAHRHPDCVSLYLYSPQYLARTMCLGTGVTPHNEKMQKRMCQLTRVFLPVHLLVTEAP